MYATKLGHAHIKVRDLDRAVAFYREFLGLVVTERVRDSYALLASPGNGAHHEIALQDVGPSAPAPPSRATGLYHVAFEVEDARSLAEADEALARAGVPVVAVDHGIGRALYFSDPDGNGIEAYLDTRGEPGGQRLWPGAPCPSPGRSCWRGSRRNPGRRPPSHRSADGSREGQASTRRPRSHRRRERGRLLARGPGRLPPGRAARRTPPAPLSAPRRRTPYRR